MSSLQHITVPKTFTQILHLDTQLVFLQQLKLTLKISLIATVPVAVTAFFVMTPLTFLHHLTVFALDTSSRGAITVVGMVRSAAGLAFLCQTVVFLPDTSPRGANTVVSTLLYNIHENKLLLGWSEQ